MQATRDGGNSALYFFHLSSYTRLWLTYSRQQHPIHPIQHTHRERERALQHAGNMWPRIKKQTKKQDPIPPRSLLLLCACAYTNRSALFCCCCCCYSTSGFAHSPSPTPKEETKDGRVQRSFPVVVGLDRRKRGFAMEEGGDENKTMMDGEWERRQGRSPDLYQRKREKQAKSEP